MNDAPDILKLALAADNYSKEGSDFTTTEILKPPQITMLAAQHEPIARPLYQGFMALLGTGVHAALEQAGTANIKDLILEKRFFHTFEIDGEKVKLGGKPDYLWNGIINDFKLVLTTGAPSGKPKPEHYWQGQFNSYLAAKDGHDMRLASVEYIFRDWTYSRAKYSKSYPQEPRRTFVFDVLPMDEIEKQIIRRLTEHVRAKRGKSRPCTRDEKWQHDDLWALKKPTAKKARKLCHSAEEAGRLKKTGEIVEFRQGACVRCDGWCEYAHVCPQKQREDGELRLS